MVKKARKKRTREPPSRETLGASDWWLHLTFVVVQPLRLPLTWSDPSNPGSDDLISPKVRRVSAGHTWSEPFKILLYFLFGQCFPRTRFSVRWHFICAERRNDLRHPICIVLSLCVGLTDRSCETVFGQFVVVTFRDQIIDFGIQRTWF